MNQQSVLANFGTDWGPEGGSFPAALEIAEIFLKPGAIAAEAPCRARSSLHAILAYMPSAVMCAGEASNLGQQTPESGRGSRLA